MKQVPDWDNRQPPQDTKAETAFLGACLLTEAAIIAGTEEGLQPSHFYNPALAALWLAIQKRFAAGKPTDTVLIQPDAAAEHPNWEGDKGAYQLIDIMTACPVAGFAPAYAQQIRETAEKRHAYTIAIKAAQDPENSAKILAQATLPPTAADKPPEVYAADGDWLQLVKPKRWIIDEWMYQGALIHLAAVGGQGKSRLMLQLAAAVASGGNWLPSHNRTTNIKTPSNTSNIKRCHIASWEDDISTYAERLVNMGYRFMSDSLTITLESKHLWHGGEYDDIGEASDRLKEMLKWAKKEAIDLLIIDPVVAAYGGNENNRQQVRTFLQTLTDAVLETEMTIMLVSHTAKATESLYSGSTDWYNAPRAFWSMRSETWGEQDDKKSATRLRLEKSNHGKSWPAVPDLWISGYPLWQHTTKDIAAQANETLKERAEEWRAR